MPTEPGTLVKIGRPEHIRQMCEDGILYLNPLSYFWKIEDGNVRGDVNDGVDAIHRGEKGKIFKLDGTEIPTNIISWEIREFTNAKMMNILCMYSLRKSTTPVDDRVLAFGEEALLFTQPQVFLNRLGNAVRSLDLNAEGDLVVYLPDNHAGTVGPFCKLSRYAWQAEWRLVIRNGPGGPLTINVGPLDDIVNVLPTIELIQLSKNATKDTFK
jgi:hypothetical protein